jgi:hypothetical protein
VSAAPDEAVRPATLAPSATPNAAGVRLHHPESTPVGRRLAVLTFGALGVVYGDIGTNPLENK